MKVLGLVISAGSGHIKAVNALKDYFAKHYRDVDMEIIDVLKYINPVINKVVIGGYIQSLKITPYFYERLYEFAENDDKVSFFSEGFNNMLSMKLNSLIKRIKPDVIVCTHPFSIEMISILKRKSKIGVPAAAILTDYAPHPMWFYENIDAYIIPHEDFIMDLIANGIKDNSIYPLGIPVYERFLEKADKKSIMKKIGMDENVTTVMVMGGGLGMGNMHKISTILSRSSLDLQIIACAGVNHKLKNELESIGSDCNKKILVYGYTDKISALMSISDILITKPGGLTIAEALVKHLPIVITSPIPGQEDKNAYYLLNNGMAAMLRRSRDVEGVIRQLVESPTRIKFMKKSAEEKAKPNAARDVCRLLISLANHRSK